MMPRPAQCDDDRCDYDETGHWHHHPQCATHTPQAEDIATTTAHEDGYGRPFSAPTQGRRAA